MDKVLPDTYKLIEQLSIRLAFDGLTKNANENYRNAISSTIEQLNNLKKFY